MADDVAQRLEVGTKVFIRNHEGKFLMLKRSHPYQGEDFCRWDIPGGRIIPGETQLIALQREVKEETGLTLTQTTTILGVQDILRIPGKHTIRITYMGLCKATNNIVLNPEEHTEYKWLTLEEIENVKHDLFHDPILEKLGARST